MGIESVQDWYCDTTARPVKSAKCTRSGFVKFYPFYNSPVVIMALMATFLWFLAPSIAHMLLKFTHPLYFNTHNLKQIFCLNIFELNRSWKLYNLFEPYFKRFLHSTTWTSGNLTPNSPLAHISFTYRKLNMDGFSVLNGFWDM